MTQSVFTADALAGEIVLVTGAVASVRSSSSAGIVISEILSSTAARPAIFTVAGDTVTVPVCS